MNSITLAIPTASAALVVALIFVVFWLTDRAARWNMLWAACHVCIGAAMILTTANQRSPSLALGLPLYFSVSFAAVFLIAGVLAFVGRKVSWGRVVAAGVAVFLVYCLGAGWDATASGYVALFVLGGVYAAGAVYMWKRRDSYSRLAALFLLVRALNAFAFKYLQTHGALDLVLVSSHLTILTTGMGLLLASYADQTRRARELQAKLIESREIEAAARRAEDHRLRQIETVAGNLPGIVYQRITRPDGSVVFPFLAGKLLEALDLEAAGAARLGSLFAPILDPEDRPRYLAAAARSERGLVPLDIEFRVRARDGQSRWLHIVATAHRAPGSGDVLWDAVAVDTTEMHRQIEARYASEARYRALFDSLPVGVTEIDPNGFVLTANPAWRRMFGFTETEDLSGFNMRDLYTDPQERDRVLSRIRHVGETAAFQAFLRRDGKAAQVDGYFNGLPDHNGELRSVICVMVDVTAAKTLEDQLRQAQKMEAVGQMTGGLAHDFNNLLTVILGNADLLVDALKDKPELKSLAELVSDAGRRGAELIRSLLAFARQQSLKSEPIDVDGLLADMAPLLRSTVGGQIQVDVVRSPALWRATADVAQLEAAILNLVVNARDAMPGGGRLTIETANANLDRAYAAQNQEVTPGAYVMIAVSDTGSGMTPEVAAHAFNPFFTTKEIGKGTGLGLSMVYGFVNQSQGHIKLYTEVGRGTTVRIYLPRSDVAERAEAPAAPADWRGRGEVVLLVEDDDMVRGFAERQLATLGYRTLAARDGAEALALLRKDGTVDLLFTDVVMPGLSGPELAAEARRLRPSLRVLYTSGYTELAGRTQRGLEPGVELLSKPYRLEDLALRLRAALRGPSMVG
jgi:PAS domain S-box-containing protein